MHVPTYLLALHDFRPLSTALNLGQNINNAYPSFILDANKFTFLYTTNFVIFHFKKDDICIQESKQLVSILNFSLGHLCLIQFHNFAKKNNDKVFSL